MASNQPEGADTIPGIALKLTKDAQQKQLANPQFVKDLTNEVDAELKLTMDVSPLMPSEIAANLAQTEAEAAANDPNYEIIDIARWYQIRFARSADTPNVPLETPESYTIQPRLVQLVQRLSDNASVLSAHFLQPGPPPVNPGQNPDWSKQGYAAPAPEGVMAVAGWQVAGGSGQGIQICDVEQGWNLNHDDLAGAKITLALGTNKSYFEHGTSVLGEMLMVDNKLGGVGICPYARGLAVSQWQNGKYNTASAISYALDFSKAGDFILIEAQENDPVSGTYFWPVEIADANFEMIKLATAKGVTVIEPACNGGRNLDMYLNKNKKNIFNRNAVAGYRESGAIMVGAGSSGDIHTRLSFSNFGTRVDMFAWGENVRTTTTNTTGTNNTLYTDTFSGTSSASPIIAGVAINVQGWIKATTGKPMPPLTLRSYLLNGATPTKNPSTDLIGVMPDLFKLIKH